MVAELAERTPATPPPQLTQQDELIRDAADYAEFFAAASGMHADNATGLVYLWISR